MPPASGGNGCSREFPVEWMHRDAKIKTMDEKEPD